MYIFSWLFAEKIWKISWNKINQSQKNSIIENMGKYFD